MNFFRRVIHKNYKFLRTKYGFWKWIKIITHIVFLALILSTRDEEIDGYGAFAMCQSFLMIALYFVVLMIGMEFYYYVAMIVLWEAFSFVFFLGMHFFGEHLLYNKPKGRPIPVLHDKLILSSTGQLFRPVFPHAMDMGENPEEHSHVFKDFYDVFTGEMDVSDSLKFLNGFYIVMQMVSFLLALLMKISRSDIPGDSLSRVEENIPLQQIRSGTPQVEPPPPTPSPPPPSPPPSPPPPPDYHMRGGSSPRYPRDPDDRDPRPVPLITTPDSDSDSSPDPVPAPNIPKPSPRQPDQPRPTRAEGSPNLSSPARKPSKLPIPTFRITHRASPSSSPVASPSSPSSQSPSSQSPSSPTTPESSRFGYQRLSPAKRSAHPYSLRSASQRPKRENPEELRRQASLQSRLRDPRRALSSQGDTPSVSTSEESVAGRGGRISKGSPRLRIRSEKLE